MTTTTKPKAEKQVSTPTAKAQAITIVGKTYPIVITMGAFLEYKRLTGRELQDVASDSISDIITLLHCILKSACRREGIEYPYSSVDDLACHITPDELAGIKLL